MKLVIKACVACALGLAGAVAPPLGAARAETEVLQSSASRLAVGTKLADNARVEVPEGSTLRVLIVTSGHDEDTERSIPGHRRIL